MSSRLPEGLVQVSLDLVLAALNVLNQVSQSCAVFHSGNLLAINSFLVHACGLPGSGGKGLEVIGTVELTMVNVLFLSSCRRKGGRCLQLLEDAGSVYVVRIFLVNTHVVPHLLLLNTIAEEAEAGALAAVEVLRRLVVHAQPGGQLLQGLVLLALVAHVPRGLSLNGLQAIEADPIAILLGQQALGGQVVPPVTISSTIV